MQKLCITVFILIKSTVLLAQQGQYNNWHFGIGNSINFTRGYAAVSGGSQIISAEACASISDSSTLDLLFYTNGDTVWSGNHSIMPNGTGLPGTGDVQQGVLIVPKPNSPGIYYIFTIGHTAPELPLELRYSIVDMSLNGGLGDIIQKNILLDTDVTEKLTATQNVNRIDYWVVSKNFATNQFKSWLVTEEGISSSPVISGVGIAVKGDSTGAIKISNNGCWMVSTIRGINSDHGIVELYHFDAATGTVYDGASTSVIQHPYGVEFSPDNVRLYVGENDRKPIHQFNLKAGNEKEVLESILDVSDTITATYSFQAGPDRRIYFVTNDTSSLGCIQNPNGYYISCNIDTAFVKGLNHNTSSLPNNFNLIYKGFLDCIEFVQGCAIDLKKFMPNAFTPNGDGLNDCYGIKFKDSLPFLDFAIFNRWGNKVFYTKSEDDCWNGKYQGKDADIGNYVYYLRLRVECGYAIKTGYVVLIR